MYRCHSALITHLFEFFCSPILISSTGRLLMVYFTCFLIIINMVCSWLFVTFFQVFSAFGFVHKIATFEKAAGFQVKHQMYWLFFTMLYCYIILIFCHSLQALIQFSDSDTASSARNALDGRSIPRHVLLCISHISPFLPYGLLKDLGRVW